MSVYESDQGNKSEAGQQGIPQVQVKLLDRFHYVNLQVLTHRYRYSQVQVWVLLAEKPAGTGPGDLQVDLCYALLVKSKSRQA